MTDLRYQQIMSDLGMPNSRSLLQALQQVAMEAAMEARAALAREPEPEPNPWRQAIDEALIVACLAPIGDNETAEQALARLVAWEVKIALDTAVSSEAAALVERGRSEIPPLPIPVRKGVEIMLRHYGPDPRVEPIRRWLGAMK